MKIQNFQNPIRTFVAGTIGRLYIKNQVNWSTFDGVITFSVEKVVPKSKREKRKESPKFSFFFFKFDTTIRNTYLGQNSAHLDHFLAFYDHFMTQFWTT